MINISIIQTAQSIIANGFTWVGDPGASTTIGYTSMIQPVPSDDPTDRTALTVRAHRPLSGPGASSLDVFWRHERGPLQLERDGAWYAPSRRQPTYLSQLQFATGLGGEKGAWWGGVASEQARCRGRWAFCDSDGQESCKRSWCWRV